MFRTLRIIVLVAAAALFGAAQAACACAPYEQQTAHDGSTEPQAGHSSHSQHGHSQHEAAGHDGQSGTASAHDCGNGGEPCEFNQLHKLAANTAAPAALTAPVSFVFPVILAQAQVFEARRPDAELRTANRGWLPPPLSSPLSLKIRLLI